MDLSAEIPVAQATAVKHSAFSRIFGVLFGSRAVAADVRRNLPYVQASIVFGVFLVLNFLLLLATSIGVFTAGSLASGLAGFSIIAFVLFAFVFFGAILWFAFSFLVFGASKLGKGADMSAGAAYCFSAYFYPVYTLFTAAAFLLSLIVWSSAFIASWYLVIVTLLPLVGAVLLFVCVHRFFSVSYKLGSGKGFLAVFGYAVGIFLLYLLLRFVISIMTGAMTGAVVGEIGV